MIRASVQLVPESQPSPAVRSHLLEGSHLPQPTAPRCWAAGPYLPFGELPLVLWAVLLLPVAKERMRFLKIHIFR